MKREKVPKSNVWFRLCVCLFFIFELSLANSASAASVTVGQTASKASSTYFYYNPGSGSAHTVINNAINAAASGASASNPGVVYIENGSQYYEVTSHILAKSYVNIVGQSRNGVVIKIAAGLTPRAYGGPGTTGWGGTDSSSGDGAIINVWSNVTTVKIENITLDGSCGDYYPCGADDRGRSEFNLMNIYRAQNVTINNVKFTNGKHDGIRNTGDNVEVANSVFDMIGHDAIQGYGVKNQVFHNNLVAIRTNSGVRCSGDGSGCFIYNNEMWTGSGGAAGVELQGAFSNVKIYNNYFHDINGNGYGAIGYKGQSPNGSGHEYYNNLFVNLPYAVDYVPSSSSTHHNIMINCNTTVGGGSDSNNIKTASGYVFQKYGTNRAGNTYWTVTSGPLASAFSGRKIGIDGVAGGSDGSGSVPASGGSSSGSGSYSGSGSSSSSGSSGSYSGGSGSSGSSSGSGSSSSSSVGSSSSTCTNPTPAQITAVVLPRMVAANRVTGAMGTSQEGTKPIYVYDLDYTGPNKGKYYAVVSSMAIDTDGSDDNPDPDHQSQTTFQDANGEHLSSERVPFWVIDDVATSLPNFPWGSKFNMYGFQVGVMIYPSSKASSAKMVYGVLGDTQGSENDIEDLNHIGEASIAAANALGIPDSGTTGGVDSDVMYVFSAGSENRVIPANGYTGTNATLAADSAKAGKAWACRMIADLGGSGSSSSSGSSSGSSGSGSYSGGSGSSSGSSGSGSYSGGSGGSSGSSGSGSYSGGSSSSGEDDEECYEGSDSESGYDSSDTTGSTGVGAGTSTVNTSGAKVLSPVSGNNNQTQINNALKGGGTVYLNAGTYVISDTIVLNSGNILTGDPAAKIVLVNNANWPMYKNMIEGIGVSNVRITGFEVDGNRDNNTTSNGDETACGRYYYTMIYFKDSSGIEVDNMYLHHNWNDIFKFVSCNNVKFHHNTVRQPGHDVVYAIYSQNVWVYNNYIRIYCNSGVRPDGTKNIYIYNNDIARDEGAGGYAGIEIQGESIVYICNNNIHDTKGGSIVDLSGGDAKIYYSGCPDSGSSGTGASTGTGSSSSSGGTGTTTSSNGTTTTSQDSEGNTITTTTDCEGNTTTTVKDSSGKTISSATTDCEGDTDVTAYDSNGNKITGDTSTDSSGNTTTTYKDSEGNTITCVKDANGNTTTTVTNECGEVISCTTSRKDANGNRIITTTDSDGNVTTTRIDANGNVTTSTSDQRGNTTTSTAYNNSNGSNGGSSSNNPNVYTETYTESATYIGAPAALLGTSSRDATIGDSVIGDAGSTGTIYNRNGESDVPEYFDPTNPMTAVNGTNGINAAIAPVSKALDALYDALTDAPESATGECTSEEGSAGILPCGKSKDDPNTDWNECNACSLCSMILMGQLTITFLIKIAATAAAISIAFAGFIYVFALGKEDLITKSKAMIKYSLIGLVTIFIAWAVVDGVLTTLGYIDPMGDQWYTTC
jgi:hypothetical protein